MMKPLALVCSENLVLSNQLVNRLQDLGYRVQVFAEPAQLVALALATPPFVILTDLVSRKGDVLQTLQQLRAQPEVSHVPVLGITHDKNPQFHAEAVAAGAKLVTMDSAIVSQLPQLLEQALAVD